MILIKLIGFFAAFCTTMSYLPQAIKTITTKDTSGLSLGKYILFNVGLLAWLIYGILMDDFIIIIANGITLIFALIILGYCITNRSISPSSRFPQKT